MNRVARFARCYGFLLQQFKRTPKCFLVRSYSTSKPETTNHSPTNNVTITEYDIQPQSNTKNESDGSVEIIAPDALDMADQYLADLNFKKAIEKYTEVLKNKSIIPEGVPEEEIYSRRAQCYHKLRKFKEARADCEAIIDNSDKNYFLAEANRRLGDMIIDEEAYSPHGDAVSRIDAASQAIIYYHRSISLASEEDTFCSLGSALLVVKEFKGANTAFSDALRIDPNLVPALQGKGDALIGQGFWAQAKDCFLEFLRLQEEYYATFSPGELVDMDVKSAICQAHLKLARINMELMESEEVKKHCQQLLELNHLFIPQANSFMARAFFLEEKFWECIEYCTKALQLDSSMFRVFKIRSAAYEQLGLSTEAAQDEKTFQFLGSKKQNETFLLENKLKVQMQKRAEEFAEMKKRK